MVCGWSSDTDVEVSGGEMSSDGICRVVIIWVTDLEKNFSSLYICVSTNRDKQ